MALGASLGRVRPLFAVLTLLLLGACDTQADAPSESSGSPSVSGSTACAEVRAGVDAFNQGDLAKTVEHFQRAVPLAAAEARADDSEAARLLVEAVTYYAELAPDDYPESARSSSEFAKYKQITLSQCVPAVVQSPGTQV